MLQSIIQCVIAEEYSHKLSWDNYIKNVEHSVTSSLSLVMVIIWTYNKTNFLTLKFVSGLLIEWNTLNEPFLLICNENT